jgi:hypothetical protein
MREGNLTAAAFSAAAREKGHYWILLIRNAEVIFVTGNPAWPTNPERRELRRRPAHATAAPQTQGWSRYISTLQGHQQADLRDPQGTGGDPAYRQLVRARHRIAGTELGGLPHMSWEEAGLVRQCTKEFEAFAGAIATAAAADRVPVADVYTAFNGIDHREDPVAKGYIQTDGIHPNDKGRAVIARTLAGLGYKPVKSPR